jgi:thiol-disulfide isomerase/thioredoxin
MFIIAPFCPCSSVQSGGTLVPKDDEKPKIHEFDTIIPPEQIDDTMIIKPLPYEPKKKDSGYGRYAPGIDEGKKLLLFFGPNCPHCRETAKILNNMAKKDDQFPEMYVIFLNEEPEKISDFFEFANRKFKHILMDHSSFFSLMGSKDVPGVLYLWNGNELAFFEGIGESEFQEGKLEKELKRKRIN